MRYKDSQFWKYILIRAFKSFYQAFIALTGFDGVISAGDFYNLDWKYILIASALTAGVSLLNNLVASIPEYADPLLEIEEAEQIDVDENNEM